MKKSAVSKKRLIEFETRIAGLYEQAKICAPIHLAGGNEDELIRIFKEYKKGDWIFCTYRSHYHWLLSGRDAGDLEKQILEGHSMHVFDDKFFTSAIVSGHLPIALGVAMALKMKGSANRVWCFMGDMAGSSGMAHECFKYARGNNLPVTFVVEDNGYCVRALTKETWGKANAKVSKCYKYERCYPHAGSGKYVMF